MDTIIAYVIQLADKYPTIGTIVFIVGGLYLLLSASRRLLYWIAKLTKTDKDNKVLDAVFAFMDKYACGLGKLGDYYETHPIVKKEEKK